MKRNRLFDRFLAAAAVALATLSASAQAADLKVVQSGPQGAVDELSQANEIRFVFSEPVVALGRIPEKPSIPQFRIQPATVGAFRWSDTRTLIFTPEKPFLYATTFEACLARGFASFSGNTLPTDACVKFTTPTLKLMETLWYRETRKVNSRVVVLLRFNQPVDGLAVSRNLSLQFAPHDFTPPPTPRAFSKPEHSAAKTAFDAAVTAARAVAARTGATPYKTLADWDTRIAVKDSAIFAIRADEVPPPGAHLKVWLGPEALGRQGTEKPGKPQEVTLTLEPPFFMTDADCQAALCNPDAWNPFNATGLVDPKLWRAQLKVTRLAVGGPPVVARPTRSIDDESWFDDAAFWRATDKVPASFPISANDAGYELRPATTYRMEVPPTLTTRDGRTLGYPFIAEIENGHRQAFASMGAGFGVWEKSGGAVVPLSVRNLVNVSEWIKPISIGEIAPLLATDKGIGAPSSTPRARALRLTPDRTSAVGLDLASALSPAGVGLAWAAVAAGDEIAKAVPPSRNPMGSLIQVTDLGLTVKDSPQGVLVLVTRLSDARPVPSARVTIRNRANEIVFTGSTNNEGIVQSPPLTLRVTESPEGEDSSWDAAWRFAFLVSAEKDGDVAFSASNWTEGIMPWEFGVGWGLEEAKPVLRGQAFADRGVYKLGEEVAFKLILRSDTPTGMKLLPANTKVRFTVKNSSDEEVFARDVAMTAWSSGEVKVKLPTLGPLGDYSTHIEATGHKNTLYGSFLVAAYRRPEFRVDSTLKSTGPAGAPLEAAVASRYLFGQSMKGRPVAWTLRRRVALDPPSAVVERFPSDRYSFGRVDIEAPYTTWEDVESGTETLDGSGRFARKFDTPENPGQAYLYLFEGDVEDATKQHIAGRAATRVEASDVFVGLGWGQSFLGAADGFPAQVVVAGRDGTPRAGVTVTLRLTRAQWTSARRAEGGGFYEWESTRTLVPAGEWTVTSTGSATEPATLKVPVPEGGYYFLSASAADEKGRPAESSVSFYATGAGYTAWERFDHNRIEIVPEKKTLAPGDIARILVKSPWETATVLLTKEREGVISRRVIPLASTQATLDVPITEADVPNVYVSVVLIKGRSEAFTTKDLSDPGKPSFRIGYTELQVEQKVKSLTVGVQASKAEFRPAESATVSVKVKDHAGAPVRSEVTLWAVDYGVLSLTGYKAPDILGSVYLNKELQVLTQDSRLNIISRRVLEPKGGEEGGGGGDLDTARRDFRPLAFWLGSVETDAQGQATRTVKLPDTLTTYRIMAVAGDKLSRFGAGEREIVTAKPLIVRSAYPRFLTPGDRVSLGAIVNNLSAQSGSARVKITSLTPALLRLGPDSAAQGTTQSTTVDVAAKGTADTSFAAQVMGVGVAKLRLEVSLGAETDVVEEEIPVRVPTLAETVAAYGQTESTEKQRLEIPKLALKGKGGLTVDLASTALVGLGEGARYVVEYPFGCSEQRSSRALVLMLAGDIGGAFSLPGIDASQLKSVAQQTLTELPTFQCTDGTFGYWGACSHGTPELTAYILSVMQRGASLAYAVDTNSMSRAYDALDAALKTPTVVNDEWRAYDNAWRAFATLVMVRGGRNVDASITRLWDARERIPVISLSHLMDTLAAKNESGERVADLRRRIENAILPEGRSSHVEEFKDPSLAWFWSSNVRTTAVTLSTLSRIGARPELATGMVRYLLDARGSVNGQNKGRWGNTHENAAALDALVSYYKKFESVTPDFRATVSMPPRPNSEAVFKGRSTVATSTSVPMADLLATTAGSLDLTLSKQGSGTLFYGARLQYYLPPTLDAPAMDQGFGLSRSYSLAEGSGNSVAKPNEFKAGDLIRVDLDVRVTKERRFVGVVDPLPAGFEPIDGAFATTARTLAEESQTTDGPQLPWLRRGGFDHVERHDDRVMLAATLLGPGVHRFSYLVRATRPGSFVTGALRAEEMYSPEIFGRGLSQAIEIKP